VVALTSHALGLQVKHILDEKEILEKLHHPFIVNLVYSFQGAMWGTYLTQRSLWLGATADDYVTSVPDQQVLVLLSWMYPKPSSVSDPSPGQTHGSCTWCWST
jgi:hypothetical protein